MNKGAPMYPDDKDRFIMDPLKEQLSPYDYYPSNVAAQKLYRCVEAMRDILNDLEDAAETQAKDKRRRKVKRLFTPICCLAEHVINLLNDIRSNPDTKRLLTEDVNVLADEIEQKFSEIVPHQHGQILRVIRNKMAAHIDGRQKPDEAHKLFSEATSAQVGLWIHASITVIADLIKLPIYQWTTGTDNPNHFLILSSNNPFPVMPVFETENGVMKRILGALIPQNDPRKEIQNLIFLIVTKSQWMFRKTDPQIRGFIEDSPESSWAKSLESLGHVRATC
jgi:hypothetical protein